MVTKARNTAATMKWMQAATQKKAMKAMKTMKKLRSIKTMKTMKAMKDMKAMKRTRFVSHNLANCRIPKSQRGYRIGEEMSD